MFSKNLTSEDKRELCNSLVFQTSELFLTQTFLDVTGRTRKNVHEAAISKVAFFNRPPLLATRVRLTLDYAAAPSARMKFSRERPAEALNTPKHLWCKTTCAHPSNTPPRRYVDGNFYISTFTLPQVGSALRWHWESCRNV